MLDNEIIGNVPSVNAKEERKSPFPVPPPVFVIKPPLRIQQFPRQ